MDRPFSAPNELGQPSSRQGGAGFALRCTYYWPSSTTGARTHSSSSLQQLSLLFQWGSWRTYNRFIRKLDGHFDASLENDEIDDILEAEIDKNTFWRGPPAWTPPPSPEAKHWTYNALEWEMEVADAEADSSNPNIGDEPDNGRDTSSDWGVVPPPNDGHGTWASPTFRRAHLRSSSEGVGGWGAPSHSAWGVWGQRKEGAAEGGWGAPGKWGQAHDPEHDGLMTKDDEQKLARRWERMAKWAESDKPGFFEEIDTPPPSSPAAGAAARLEVLQEENTDIEYVERWLTDVVQTTASD